MKCLWTKILIRCFVFMISFKPNDSLWNNASMLNLLKINLQLRNDNFSVGNGYYMQEVRLEFRFFQLHTAYLSITTLSLDWINELIERTNKCRNDSISPCIFLKWNAWDFQIEKGFYHFFLKKRAPSKDL